MKNPAGSRVFMFTFTVVRIKHIKHSIAFDIITSLLELIATRLLFILPILAHVLI